MHGIAVSEPMSLFRIALIVIFAASVQAQPLDPPPTDAQLREWAGDELARASKRSHFDYAGALERAIRKEPAGLAALFRYTVDGDTDGAAGEAHASVLFGLLQRWGDKPFARVLRAQKLDVRKAVVADIGWPEGGEKKYPITAASAPH